MAHILVVDDEKSIRVMISAFLQGQGYMVEVAQDADEARKMLSTCEWDVVLTDIILPGVSGVELLKTIRELAPDVQVIMMTGAPTVESAAEAVRAGACDYLTKPVNRQALQRSVATAAQLKQLNDDKKRLTLENRKYQENLECLVEDRTRALSSSREQLRALAARLQAVREEERTRVAREIHDVLAQELTRLKIDLVWTHGRLTNPAKSTPPETLAARVSDMIQMADESIRSVQAIATDLRPAVLDSLGLCAAVEWKARDFEAHVGIQCQVVLPKEELVVGREVATATFRIVQESLTNVIRHAQATKVDIILGQELHHLVLKVEDNGCGIPAELLNDPMCIGLAGMRERALLLGGQFEIQSQPGHGTKIEMRLPLSPTDTLATGEE